MLIVVVNCWPFIVRNISSFLFQSVPVWKALLKLWPRITSCVSLFETTNVNVNLTGPILKVMSHYPLFSIIEPFAAFIRILLGNSWVLSFSGIVLYLS